MVSRVVIELCSPARKISYMPGYDHRCIGKELQSIPYLVFVLSPFESTTVKNRAYIQMTGLRNHHLVSCCRYQAQTRTITHNTVTASPPQPTLRMRRSAQTSGILTKISHCMVKAIRQT